MEKEGNYFFDIDGQKVKITREMLQIERELPSWLQAGETPYGTVYLDVTRNEALEAEGYAREITRQVQQLRKEAGLEKKDRINLHLQAGEQLSKAMQPFLQEMQEKVGAIQFSLSAFEAVKSLGEKKEFTVKKEKFIVWIKKV